MSTTFRKTSTKNSKKIHPPTAGTLQPAVHVRRKAGTVSSDTSSLYGSHVKGSVAGVSVFNPFNASQRGMGVVLANTYNMEPVRKFPTKEVKEIMDSVLQSYLQDCDYDTQMCPRLCESLSTLIKNRVKDLNVCRYRLVCLVTIAQNTGQGLHIAARYLWDHSNDMFTSAAYENKSLVCVATVYALYLE